MGGVFKWPKRPIFSFITILCIEIKRLFGTFFGRCADILTFNSECTWACHIVAKNCSHITYILFWPEKSFAILKTSPIRCNLFFAENVIEWIHALVGTNIEMSLYDLKQVPKWRYFVGKKFKILKEIFFL